MSLYLPELHSTSRLIAFDRNRRIDQPNQPTRAQIGFIFSEFLIFRSCSKLIWFLYSPWAMRTAGILILILNIFVCLSSVIGTAEDK